VGEPNTKLTLIHFDLISAAIASVKWDAPDLSTQHSPYVDLIHARFLDLITCLDDGGRSLSRRMRHIVLGGAALNVAEMVVEGYSRIRRTGENTPLIMSNDVNTLKTSLEHLSKMRPFPYMEHVQDFSRAFFLDLESSDMVIEWAKQHTNYPPHRISGDLAHAQHLIRCA
jgi:hypothetical protein